MGTLLSVVFLFLIGICFAVSVFIVNAVFRMIMNITDSDAIFYNIKLKISAYIFCTVLIIGLIMELFGIGI